MFNFCSFFNNFKYDFHIDAEKMIIRRLEMSRNICVDELKKKILALLS